MVKSSPEKLAQALRANLKRRKQAAPARPPAGPPESVPSRTPPEPPKKAP